MPFNVSLLLPNNLSSSLLKGEFIEQGQIYNTNRFHEDPLTDQNKTTLIFSFELRDITTRQKVQLTRIKQLSLSNDPQFDPSATVNIVNLPDLSLTFDSAYNYSYYLNTNYFNDPTLSQELTPRPAPSAGSGYFYIYNWPLSANGGLSRVFMKAVIEGPDGAIGTYPNDIGIYDEILWQGEIPAAPQNPDFGVLKSGWTSSDPLLLFNTASDSLTANYSNGINTYLGSILTLGSTGSTYDALSANSSVKRSIIPSSSVGSTTLDTYRFYRDGTRNYSSYSFSLGSSIALTSGTFGRGAFFYTKSKFPYSSTKSDIYTQAAFNYSVSSIGVTSSAFIKIFDQPDYSANGKEIVLRLDIPNNSYPTAYLNLITAGTESVATQTTTLPNNMLPLLQSGGLMEMYYSSIDSSYGYIEAYFTPYLDQNTSAKTSYLLANSLVSSFGSTSLGSAFGYQITGSTGSTGSINLSELFIANGKSKLSVDIGDCGLRDNNNISFPITKITTNWSLYNDDEYKILQETPVDLSITSSVGTNYIEVNKIDSSSTNNVNGIYEIQLLKPSLSNKTRIDFTLLHRSDDFYVALSPTSSYRQHLESGVTQYWERPMGSRVDQNFSLSDEPNYAPTIMLKFSSDKNTIFLLQRNEDNTFIKHSLKTYTASAAADSWSIEITDQAPDGVTGTKRRKDANAHWIYLKKQNGSNLELVGFAQLSKKLHSNSTGLGYYASIGFKESSFNTGSNRLSSLAFYGLPKSYNTKSDNNEKIGSFLLSDEGLSNSKHYLGIKTLSSLTDFIGFQKYKTPVNGYVDLNVELATTGTNVDITSLNSSTVDGVALSSISSGKYVLIKDQINSSENGLYLNSGTSWIKYNVAYDYPLRIQQGTINSLTTWYKKQIQYNNNLIDRFVCTTFLKDITIGEISSFVNSLVPSLLEFKANWKKFDVAFPYKKFRIRFFSDSSSYPTTALTSWITPSLVPLRDTFGVVPNNDLVQIYIDPTVYTSLTVSASTKIWVAIDTPFGAALGEAYGPDYIESDYISTGLYSGYSLAKNLWHKLYSRTTDKSLSLDTNNSIQYRIRSISHANVSSMPSNLSSSVFVDKNGPSYSNDAPLVVISDNSSTRQALLRIYASDTESGIMSFRVGREIDNKYIEYTPWMAWDEFLSDTFVNYSLSMNGHYNYNYLSAIDSAFQSQNVGYSGARKIWVQIMDYAGNITESYPVTFLAKTWMMVDTEPPYGNVEFYDPESDNTVYVTNGSNMGGIGSTNISTWVKINADDLISGVKDFKIRKIKDTGPDSWSSFENFNLYRIVDFTGELDGVKRVEVAFRDYGNNIVQPEISWKKVLRPRK